jgi:hypothetical protein
MYVISNHNFLKFVCAVRCGACGEERVYVYEGRNGWMKVVVRVAVRVIVCVGGVKI